MRTLPDGLRGHLDSGATTLCYCWRLETAGGDTMGFTDHDRDLSFSGVSFEAHAGFAATDIETSLGLGVDNLDAAGALQSERLTAARLLAGDFDNAAIEVWLVNWQDPSQRLLMRKGHLGEVSHGSLGFSAELRGLSHVLNQPRGRIVQYGCDAVLGDARCGVDLSDSAHQASCTVTAIETAARFHVSGAAGFASNWFNRGTAKFTSGLNDGRRGQVKFHHTQASGTAIELWQPMPFGITAGDSLILQAGCDKQFSTCRLKFANQLNFRGFPHVPGDDFVLGYPRRGDPANTGSSLSIR